MISIGTGLFSRSGDSSMTQQILTRMFRVALLASVVVVCVAGSASAAPVWRVGSAHGPQNFEPGGVGEYAITAFNTAFNTTNNPVITTSNATVGAYTIVDTLPAGVEATDARGGGWECVEQTKFPATVVTCTRETTLFARSASIGLNGFSIIKRGATPPLYIEVQIASNAPVGATVDNEVTVSGGGGAPASTTDPTTFDTTQPGFGLVGNSFQFGAFDGLFPGGNGVSQAGAHPFEMRYQMKYDLKYTNDPTLGAEGPFTEPDRNVRTVVTRMPFGFSGDPQATPQCTDTQFNTPAPGATGGFPVCPAGSQVGTISLLMNNVASLVGEGTPFAPGPNVTQDIPLYNMVPSRGAIADLGFVVQTIPTQITISLDPSDHYRIVSTAANLTKLFPIREAIVSLWGVPAEPAHNLLRFHASQTGAGSDSYYNAPANVQQVPFITLPSQCDTPTGATARLDSWQEPEHWIDVSASEQTATGCEQQSFDASIKAQPTTTEAGAPTGLSLDVHASQNLEAKGLGTPPIKKVVVTLPEGMTLSPSAAGGLQACSPAQIGLGTNNPVGCPEASKLADVTVKTPALAETLEGAVYLASQNDNPFHSLIAMYMVIEDKERGLLIKLPGEGKLDPSTGRLTTTFDENPQVPFSDLHLQFKSGPRAPLMNPTGCGTYATSAAFTSWNTNLPTVQSSDPFTLTSNCNLGFAPSFTAGTTSNQAGAFSPFVLSFSRTDADQQISGLTDTFPPGASAVLKGVAECSDAQVKQAEEGTGGCPETSRIGSVTVGAGAGSPYFLKGSVYLTDPYNNGPFGEAVIVPAIAGPFNLGNVVVRGSIRIDPKTAQPTVVSDPFPRFVKSTGIPTDIRRVDVTLDRQKFTFNPTSCKELKATATLTSTQGATANVSSRFEAAECRDLGFHPSFRATTVAKTSRKLGAALHVTVKPGTGQANIARVDTQVPKGFAVRDSTLNQACTERQFAANPAACPAGSFVGSATASTPILAGPLSGPAIFVSHGGAKFPDLDIVLQGEGVTVILTGGTEVKKNLLFSHFDTVPDAPVSGFALSLPEGPHSALAAVGNLCTQRVGGRQVRRSLIMPTTITGQNGAVVHQSTKVSVSGCGRPAKAQKRK
jgi:hypothetical protein